MVAKRGLLALPQKGDKAPPVVGPYVNRAVGSTVGLGVLIAPDLVLTCEHIVIGGPIDYGDVLNNLVENRLQILEAYVEGIEAPIPPANFGEILDDSLEIDPNSERLVLLKVSGQKSTGDTATIATPTGTSSDASIWALFGEPRGQEAHLTSVVDSTFTVDGRLLVSNEFENNGKLVQGHSGGGVFLTGTSQLIGIQNAMRPGTSAPNVVRAQAIGIHAAIDWINSIIGVSARR